MLRVILTARTEYPQAVQPIKSYYIAFATTAMLLFMAVVVSAQTDTTAPLPGIRWLGAFGSIGVSGERASLVVPGFEGCGVFTTGSSTGWRAGALFEIPVLDSLSRLRIGPGIAGASGSFTPLPVLFPTVARDCTIVEGRVDQLLTFRRTDLTFDAVLARSVPMLSPQLSALFGFRATVPLSTEQSYKQAAVKPDDLLLLNNARELTVRTDEIFASSSFGLNIVAGLSFDLPIAEHSTISPELIAVMPITSNTSAGSWRSFQLQLGAALRFGIMRNDTTPVIAIKDSNIHTPPLPAPLLHPVILTVPDTVGVSITEYDSTEALPLLNKIFFDEYSGDIGPQYKMLTADEATTFSNSQLTGSAIEVYYNLLNIIAQRMKTRTNATLKVNGYCNGHERNAALARKRALVVKDYLVNVWHISPRKITVTGSADPPPNGTRESSKEAFEENSCVEIIASDPNVTIPVLRRYIQRIATPPTLTFYPQAIAEAGVLRWSLDITQRDTLWRRFNGSGRMPDSLSWNWRDMNGELPGFPMQISYALSVTDSTDRTVKTRVRDIDVVYTSLNSKLEFKRNDTTIERYSLLLFSYDSPRLSRSDQQLLKAIAALTQPNAVVQFIGYTDSLGGEEHNKILADQRAREAARMFRDLVPNSVSISVSPDGGPREQFPYDTPEGRSHCRTVAIEVRTPSKRE